MASRYSRQPGSEDVLVLDAAHMPVTVPYSEEKDGEFLGGEGAADQRIVLVPGFVSVFFPEDAHKPSLLAVSQLG